MTKLSDIAQVLGVSTATVSNALTGKGRMKETTRRQIREIALAMGYTFTQAPRNQCNQIILVTEANQVNFSSEIASGLIGEAMRVGMACAIYDLNILTSGFGRDATVLQLRPLVEACIQQHPMRPACVIYIAQYPRRLPGLLEGLDCPAVGVFCQDTGAQVNINYDDQQGAYQAVEHLIQMGCRSIAMISGPVDSYAVSERMIGYQRALIQHGLIYHPKLVWIGDWEVASGRALTHALLEANTRPDAIFAQNDAMAVGALQAAHDKGLRVPEDLAIVGFDNNPFATWTDPTLSSVAPPFREMGQNAFINAYRLVCKQKPDASNLCIPCSLIIRKSSQKTST